MEIGLITYTKQMSDIFKSQINKIFGDSFIINQYIFNAQKFPSFSSNDAFRIVLLPSTHFKGLNEFLPKDKPIIKGSSTFKNEGLLKLKTLPQGSRVLFVNINKNIALETITLLYQKNILNIDFIPYTAEEKIPLDINIAVTSGEIKFVPKNIKNIIDIGNRHLDIRTIVDIAFKAEKEEFLETKNFFDYCKLVSNDSENVIKRLIKYERLNNEFNTLVHMLDIGIIAVDDNDKIYMCNQKFSEWIKIEKNTLIGKNINTIIPENIIKSCHHKNTLIKSKIELLNLNFVEITVIPLINKLCYLGCFIILSPQEKENTIQNHLVTKLLNKGHYAKYDFTDIIGDSEEIKKTIKMAKMMAKSDSHILITGESGTGKEILAHAIHKNSNRKNNPFVVINCGAIPDSLLESELFGYEKGAFTGANKNGKIGLLEIANNGTVFFDEIENMSFNLQTKILRFIQEKEIIKIGGDAVIHLNVRIISATNKNLMSMVKLGKFREDLYYRISTLPIFIPSLKTRRNDILLIFSHIQKNLGVKFFLSEEAKDILISYNWPGNIRELENCVKYLSCLNSNIIEYDQLPNYLFDKTYIKNNNFNISHHEKILIYEIAKLMLQGTCGRNYILKQLEVLNLKVTESQIRHALKSMKKNKWISSGKGRQGSCITEIGKKELLNM